MPTNQRLRQLPGPGQDDDTLDMTLKGAAMFALIGIGLLTVVGTVNLIVDLSGMLRGFIPAVTVLAALIEWLAGLSLVLFFAVFHRTQ